ncbi:MAG: alpha/beta hydrolase [Christensenellaceae bacterium]|nr:alpha/beta hydrolase [Christensenellaceae bacterium]
MKIVDDFFKSSDSIHQIHARWHIPENPKAVLRISHGMCEYTARYDDFAAFMTENGFVVCGNDHLGHGESVGEDRLFGYFAHKDGLHYLIEDTKKLGEIAADRFPGLPQFLLGHSMGSLLVRHYLTQYGKELSACVICGTLGPLPAAGASLAVAKLISALHGAKKSSGLLNAIAFGGYLKRIPKPNTVYDWICTDETVVAKYAEDPFCTYRFTNSAMCDLIQVYGIVSQNSWAEKLPKDLPLFLISGAEDPCGNYGKGVEEIHRRICNAGIKNTQLKIYPDVRHEILNDKSKTEVYADVLGFLNNYLSSED